MPFAALLQLLGLSLQNLYHYFASRNITRKKHAIPVLASHGWEEFDGRLLHEIDASNNSATEPASYFLFINNTVL
jgi:hypothetical protein